MRVRRSGFDWKRRKGGGQGVLRERAEELAAGAFPERDFCLSADCFFGRRSSEMASKSPVMKSVVTREEPPWERRGRVIPVRGIAFTTPPILKRV